MTFISQISCWWLVRVDVSNSDWCVCVCVWSSINQKKWILLSDHDRTGCTRWVHMNTININRTAYTSTVNQACDNFIVPLKTWARTCTHTHCLGDTALAFTPSTLSSISYFTNNFFFLLPTPPNTEKQRLHALESRFASLDWCHSNSPSKSILSNRVTDRIHSSTAPSLSTTPTPIPQA